MDNSKSDFIGFVGGLDQSTPNALVPSGTIADSQNYEIGVNGIGYIDHLGYERFTGQPAPSDATYSTMYVLVTGAIVAGDVLSGVSSLTNARVLRGAPGPGSTKIVILTVSAAFTIGEEVTVSGLVQGTVQSLAVENSEALSPGTQALYTFLAAVLARALMTDAPGEGAILGVWMLNDIKYCVRNAVGGATAVLLKESASGWTTVPLGRELAFTSAGTYVLADGDVITGETSNATATVGRVALQTGTFAGGDGAGYLFFASQTGTFQAETIKVGANLNVANIAGNSAAITLLPGGVYETVQTNFGGALGSSRIYGCNGVGTGFEFDGTTWAKVRTGMTTDVPSHVFEHKNQLFLSFGPSSQNSGIGTPFKWSAVSGAAEINVGATITGYVIEPGSTADAALGIYCRNRIHMLYGNSSADWNLIRYREEIGAYPRTIQSLGMTLFFDDRGINSLRTAQEFGNFQHSTLSRKVQNFLETYSIGSTPLAYIVREKNQYRLHLGDRALYVTMSGPKVAGIMPQLLSFTPNCVWSGEKSDGTEVIYMGGTDGRVYQMERGTNFDGVGAGSYMITHYDLLKSPNLEKAFLKGAIEVRIGGADPVSAYAKFRTKFSLNYGELSKAQPSVYVEHELTRRTDILPGASRRVRRKLGGTATCISIDIRKSVTSTDPSTPSADLYSYPVLFSGIDIRFIPRRAAR